MLEIALLAIVIILELSSWWATGIAGAGFLASVVCTPYWEDKEDRIFCRLATFVCCGGAVLIETGRASGDEVRRYERNSV